MADDLDEIAARAYAGLDDLWIEDRCERWVAPHIASWCEGLVLDMGWGTGTMGRALLAEGVDLTVVEGSADLAVRAAECGVPVLHALFEEAGIVRAFDTVLCLFVLEHVEDPVGLLERVYKWLKPGGRLIVAVPNATSIHRRVGSLLTDQPADAPSERDVLVGHRRVYTLPRLCDDVSSSGFEVTGTGGWFCKPVPNSMMLGWAPEMIDALCQIGWDGRPYDAANLIVIANT